MDVQGLINEFLAQKRFAMVGVSRNPREFSRTLFEEFLKRGFDVVPVNPNADEIGGRQCYRRVQDIEPRTTSALLMTAREKTEEVVKDCAEAGMTLVWVFGISGPEDIARGVFAACEHHGIKIVPGYCPFMFLPSAAFFHRMHGFFAKMFGKYPKHSVAAQ